MVKYLLSSMSIRSHSAEFTPSSNIAEIGQLTIRRLEVFHEFFPRRGIVQDKFIRNNPRNLWLEFDYTIGKALEVNLQRPVVIRGGHRCVAVVLPITADGGTDFTKKVNITSSPASFRLLKVFVVSFVQYLQIRGR